MNILITGFEPFGDTAINPSEQVIKRLGEISIPGVILTRLVLPVDQDTAPLLLKKILRETRFDAVLCLGEASGNSVIALERIAINLLDFRIPDNAGNQIVDQPVDPNGQAAYFSTLPLRAIEHSLRDHGIPVSLSCSAGTYLCNQIMYTLLSDLATRSVEIPAGFIHLPALPVKAASYPRPLPSMSLETCLEAITLTIQVLAKQGSTNDCPDLQPEG